MSGINFLSDNLMDTATLSLTAGTADSQYPLSNVQLESTTKKFRSTGNVATIQLDLGQNRTIDTIAIVGDATVGLGVTALTVKTSLTTDFSGSTPIVMTLNAEFNMGYEFVTPVSHRFVQLEFTGTGSYVEVSNLFIGERLNLPQNSFAIRSFRYRENDNTQTKYNDYRQKFNNVLNFSKRLVGTIEYCTKSEQDELDTMFLAHGRHVPLWVIVDPDSDAMTDGKYKLSMYGYMEKMPSWNAVGGQLWNAGMEMEQVI